METVIKYICNHSKLCPDKEGCRHSVEHIPDYDCSELCGDKTSQCVPYYYLKSKMNLVMLLHEQGYFLTYQEQLEITGWLKEHDESCLVEHDRELKEALERWGILENEFDFWADNEFKEQWNQFWKERGIE